MARPANGTGSLLAVDVGNTSIKFARVRGATVKILGRHPTPKPGDQTPDPPLPPLPAIVVSVVAAATPGILESVARRTRKEVRLFGRDVAPPMPIDYAEPGSLGLDRVAAALGAWLETKAPVVVVSAGTALTVDVVDGGGVFRGGAIAPGFATLGAALHAAAPALPRVAPAPGSAYPGRSTRDCLMAGVSAAARGTLRELVSAARSRAGPDARVFVTGGDAETALAMLPGAGLELRAHLVLRGAAAAADLDRG